MARTFVFILVLFVFSLAPSLGQEGSKSSLNLFSPAFKNHGNIPSTYTCDGLNINPPLKIERVPLHTQSLALVFDDMDAPRGSYVHWILWNIDPAIKEIMENSVPEGAVQGLNDFKKNHYGGPCPPRRTHRYVFKLYALDCRLNLSPHSTKMDLEKAMAGHVLAQARWIGVYQRVRPAPK